MIRKQGFPEYFPKWIWPAIIFLSIATVWLRLQIVDTTYQIHQAEQQIQNAKHTDEKLELKTAQLRSPKRLEMLAKTKFKLAPPEQDQVIRVQTKEAAQ
ncbi:MAG: cell division protein FtsL [Xanthomonadaceae bacterium]|nr:cell division protein FtsL [Xanthomonadaceae bacterium]